MRGARALRIVGLLLQIAGAASGGLGAVLCIAMKVHETNAPDDVVEGAGAAAAVAIAAILLGIILWGFGWGLRGWSKN
jgi:hypothetical protein